MKVYYIKEKEDTCDIVKMSMVFLKKIFNNIDVENINGKVYYILPIFKKTKLSKYRAKRLAKKIVKKLEKDGIQNIALSNCLDKYDFLKLYLYSKNINILDGRFLFRVLQYEVIEYILKRKKKKIQERRSNNINK